MITANDGRFPSAGHVCLHHFQGKRDDMSARTWEALERLAESAQLHFATQLEVMDALRGPYGRIMP